MEEITNALALVPGAVRDKITNDVTAAMDQSKANATEFTAVASDTLAATVTKARNVAFAIGLAIVLVLILSAFILKRDPGQRGRAPSQSGWTFPDRRCSSPDSGGDGRGDYPSSGPITGARHERQVASAFGGNAAVKQSWEEF